MQLKPPNMLRRSWSRIFPSTRLNSERRKRKKPLHTRRTIPLFVLIVIAILPALPRSSSISLALPDGDPAPGRSPGPPESNGTYVDMQFELNVTEKNYNAEDDRGVAVITSVVEVANISGLSDDSDMSEDLCSCRDSDVITIDARDSDVNLTFSHPVFDTEVELVRGVTYEVRLVLRLSSLRDYTIQSTIAGVRRGLFSATAPADHACLDPPHPPLFIPKHNHLDRPQPITKGIKSARTQPRVSSDRSPVKVDFRSAYRDVIKDVNYQYNVDSEISSDAMNMLREKRTVFDDNFNIHANLRLSNDSEAKRKQVNDVSKKLRRKQMNVENDVTLNSEWENSGIRQVKPKGIFQNSNDQWVKPEGIFQNSNDQWVKPEGIFQNSNDQWVKPEGIFQNSNDQWVKPEGIFQNSNDQWVKSKVNSVNSYDQWAKLKERQVNSNGHWSYRGKRAISEGRKVPGRLLRLAGAGQVAGPLVERTVMVNWAVEDSTLHEELVTNVTFRLRYRKTSSTTVYQVFFTKVLRLECMVRMSLRATPAPTRLGSWQLPAARACRVLLPAPAARHAILAQLLKLNVPCAAGGYLRFAPNTPRHCGKLEEIAQHYRRYFYSSTTAGAPTMELQGRPAFLASFRIVDYCHDVTLTARNGSFLIGPARSLRCSYTIHLPYGNQVALRLQLGSGVIPITEEAKFDSEEITDCAGMSINLQDGDKNWKHCSQDGDPLRNVQIVSKENSIRLNIQVSGASDSNGVWLKVFWIGVPVEAIAGQCSYGWVYVGGDDVDEVCVAAFRDARRGWRQAEAECVRRGGHLASIRTERHQLIIDQMLLHSADGGPEDVYWVGATDLAHEGEFRWSDGLPFQYAHWFPGWRKLSPQPNDDGMSGQDCVELRRWFGAAAHAHGPRPHPPPTAQPTYMWNDRGCQEHNYYICGRPLTDEPFTGAMPACNDTIHLSRSNRQATISSPGFPRHYPDSVCCVSDVTAPPGHTLQVDFEELTLENEAHCSYDYLEIMEVAGHNYSDGEHERDEYLLAEHPSVENEVLEENDRLVSYTDAISSGFSRNFTAGLLVRRLCGDWSAKLKLLRYQSTTSRLRVRFVSDYSHHYGGFKAKVSLGSSTWCEDSRLTLFEGNCYLFAGYPRVSWLTAHQVCEGMGGHLASIHSADEQRFVTSGVRNSADYSAGAIYWLGARVQHPRNLSAAFATWSDGTEVTYQGWAPSNDTEEEIDVLSCLGIQWKTLATTEPSGLYWTAHKCGVTGGYVCKRQLHTDTQWQNRTVEGDTGTLVSPHHPSVYPHDLDYSVAVVGPEHTRIVIVFTHLDVEYQKDCLYDFVELHDISTGKWARRCGSLNAPSRWASSDHRATVRFRSDYSTAGTGFALTWRAVDMAGCPAQTITSKEGVIRSPNYPDFLLSNIECTFKIIAPVGKRVFLNISFFDFGYGSFVNGLQVNATIDTADTRGSELSVGLGGNNPIVRPFTAPGHLTEGIFVSDKEVLSFKLSTGDNPAGKGFQAFYKTVNFVDEERALVLGNVRAGRLTRINWPAAAPTRSRLRMRLLAPHRHTLALAFTHAAVARPQLNDGQPCGEGQSWIEVRDNYAESNGTMWVLCERERKATGRGKRSEPLVITSYLHSLLVTQCATNTRGVNINATVLVQEDPEYHNKLLQLADDTSLESCFPDPCMHQGRCITEDNRHHCQCSGYYTGMFCALTACERSPCSFGNCSLAAAAEEGFECACAAGWSGRRCAVRVRPCASRPCNNRGACIERADTFQCRCNPAWKGPRCEQRDMQIRYKPLTARMLQEPFWLGIITVFVVMGAIGLVWCAKRHFPEKIEKLLAEEADRCARPHAASLRCSATAAAAPGPEPAGAAGGAAQRSLFTRLGIRKPSVLSLVASQPGTARTFSLDDLLKPPPRRTPSPRKKRNNSTPTKKNAAEKKQILQQLISPAAGGEHAKKISMGELIQMSERRTLSTVESAPAFVNCEPLEHKETSFGHLSEASSSSTPPSMRHLADPKLEKKVTFARLLNKVSAEMSSSSEVDMSNTIAIPMAVLMDSRARAGGIGGSSRSASTPPSPGQGARSPHSTSSNQGSDSMSSLDFTLAHAALKKYSHNRSPKISSADSILAMFRNFSSTAASPVGLGTVSASSSPSASPQDDISMVDDDSCSSLYAPTTYSGISDSPTRHRPGANNTIEIQVLDPLTAHKSNSGNFLHPPTILLEVPSAINKYLSPIRELPTPLPTPLPSPAPTPRLPRSRLTSVDYDEIASEVDDRRSSIDAVESERSNLEMCGDDRVSLELPSACTSDDEIDCDRPTSASHLRLKLRPPPIGIDTPTPSTQLTDTPSPLTHSHSHDSERETSSSCGRATASPPPLSPAPIVLRVPLLTVERPSPGSPPPRRCLRDADKGFSLDLPAPPPLITVTYNASEAESDEPLSPAPAPPPPSNMCYLSPFSMSVRGERAPSDSNLSSSGYSSMASPGPSRCGSSNPLCPSEMEDPGAGGGGGPHSYLQRRRSPLLKTNSNPGASSSLKTSEDDKNHRRGRSDSETLSDDPLLESNDEGIGTDQLDERVDDVPTSAKELELVTASMDTLDTMTLAPSGVTKCVIGRCASVERGLDVVIEKATLRPPSIVLAGGDSSRPLSPVSSRSESPLSDKTGLGRFSPHFFGRQLPFTDSDGLYDFPSSECVRAGSASNIRGSLTGAPHRKSAGKRRERRPRAAATPTSPAANKQLPHSLQNLLEVPTHSVRGVVRKGGARKRSRSQQPAPASSSSSSSESASVASATSVASARELHRAADPPSDWPDVRQPRSPLRHSKLRKKQSHSQSSEDSCKVSSSLDLAEEVRKPQTKISRLRTISNQIRFLRRLEQSLKMREKMAAASDDEGDESSSVTSPLLAGRKDAIGPHAASAPLLYSHHSARPRVVRQKRYLAANAHNDNSD